MVQSFFGDVLKENSSSFYSRSPLVPNRAAQALMTVTLNMAAFTGPERASCVFWFDESKSATTFQRNFLTKYAKFPLSRPTIYEPDTTRVFLLGFRKRYGIRTPLPVTLPELRARIYAAAEQVTPEMLVRVWEEIDYRWDVCRISKPHRTSLV
ncbi:hypothetical protein J6590_079841 [Homalodisca vitripennis]|nr:hypothetical protein J6590_079841 [Homalodisca vitripennis]